MTFSSSFAAKAAIVSLCLPFILAGCGDKKKSAENDAVSGQVIAKVAGKEVTVHELDAERRAAGSRIDPNDDKADKLLLKAMVERKALVAKAEAQGIDRQASVLLAIRRQREVFLAQQYLEQEIARRPAVARGDIDKFILDNPQMFAQRQTYAVDELAVATGEVKPDFVEATKNVKNLDEVEKVLKDRKIDYHHVVAALNSAELNVELVDHLAHPKAEDVLVLRAPVVTLFLKVITSRSDPIVGDQAVDVARRVLQTKANSNALHELGEGALSGTEVQYEGPYAKMMAAPDAPAAGASPAPAAADPNAPKQQ